MESKKYMIKLVADTIDRKDLKALSDWMLSEPSPQLTKGDLTRELEAKWSEKIHIRYSVFVNSGSSAILLTLAALQHLSKAKLKVVTSALSWATDVSSPMLLGCETILCDCNLQDLSVDLKELEKIFIRDKPDVFILVTPLGLVPKFYEILRLCNKYDVELLNDSCESMGSKIGGLNFSKFGLATFYSMYFGHHISTIEGGFISTNNEELYHLLLMMRSHGWDRDLPHDKQQELRQGKNDFESLYDFYVPAFNLRSTDLQAFLGLRAIDKLDKIVEVRQRNYLYYREKLKVNELDLSYDPNNTISNFA